jgi:hypothetical protein
MGSTKTPRVVSSPEVRKSLEAISVNLTACAEELARTTQHLDCLGAPSGDHESNIRPWLERKSAELKRLHLVCRNAAFHLADHGRRDAEDGSALMRVLWFARTVAERLERERHETTEVLKRLGEYRGEKNVTFEESVNHHSAVGSARTRPGRSGV